MFTQKNRSGSVAIIIILVIVGTLIAGLIVFGLMGSKKQASNTNSTAKQNSAVDGATKYLAISEWGIKFALTTDTADAYYDSKTNSNLDSMSLRVHSLDSEPDCKTAAQSVATIFRVGKDAVDETMSNQMYSQTQTGQTIGNYFYFIQGSQYSCAKDTERMITLQAVKNSLNTAGSTIQAQ